MSEVYDKDLQRILKAEPCDEPDRAKIKWRKQKWKLPEKIGDNVFSKRYTHRPPAKVYYDILKTAGKNVCVCELCGGDYKITVHHRDGNPFNNKLENLQVLCWHCHLLFHNSIESGVHDELEGTKADIDPLDDEETRKFLGIIDEERDI